MTWERKFEDPITLSDGRKLITSRTPITADDCDNVRRKIVVRYIGGSISEGSKTIAVAFVSELF